MAQMTYRQKKKAFLAICCVAALAVVAAAAVPAILPAGDAGESAAQEQPQQQIDSQKPQEDAAADGREEADGQGVAEEGAEWISAAKRAELEDAIADCLRLNGFDPDETQARILLETNDGNGNPVCYFRVDPDWCFSATYASGSWSCSPLRERVAGVNDDLSDDRVYSSTTRKVTSDEAAKANPKKTCPVDDAATLSKYLGDAPAAAFAADFAEFLAGTAPGHDASSCVVALDYANRLNDGSAAIAVYDPADGAYYTAIAKKGEAHAEFSKQ